MRSWACGKIWRSPGLVLIFLPQRVDIAKMCYVHIDKGSHLSLWHSLRIDSCQQQRLVLSWEWTRTFRIPPHEEPLLPLKVQNSKIQLELETNSVVVLQPLPFCRGRQLKPVAHPSPHRQSVGGSGLEAVFCLVPWPGCHAHDYLMRSFGGWGAGSMVASPFVASYSSQARHPHKWVTLLVDDGFLFRGSSGSDRSLQF